MALARDSGGQRRLWVRLRCSLRRLEPLSPERRGRRSVRRWAKPPPTGTVPSGANVPELTPASDLKPPDSTCRDEPIEPYLLTKDAGPFMVMARVFRGPDAQRMAIALAKELRTEYGLPAYIFRKKEFPGGSMIRGTPPQRPAKS